MTRIEQTFKQLKVAGKKALIPFITAGDPSPLLTVELMHALVRGGADILELGVPFSDPMADGPVIQRASERALAQGTRLRDVLSMVVAFRESNQTTPVVLMGYLNPLEIMGYSVFAQAAQIAGVDGMLTVDCPPEEAAILAPTLEAANIAPIFLLSPTTPVARMQKLAQYARGYVYYVSLKGVTGAANLDVASVAAKLPEIRQVIDLPIGVGFGIRDGATARQVAEVADAVVIGSRLVQLVESTPVENLAQALESVLSEIRCAMDA